MKLDNRLACPRALAFLTTATLVLAAGCSSTQGDVDSSSSSSKSSVQDPQHGADMKLPPGWTEKDMQACMEAGMPGPMQAHLMKQAGTWTGTNTMWMAPGSESMKTEMTATITKEMDGRYTKCEYKGDMPGMGPFHGLGYNGFDNVSQKFVSTWIDNHSSGIMNGEGTLSPDGRTMTWTFEYNCPINKRPTTMRQIERYTGEDAMTLEMHGKDPKSGQDFKMMEIEMKRTGKPKS